MVLTAYLGPRHPKKFEAFIFKGVCGFEKLLQFVDSALRQTPYVLQIALERRAIAPQICGHSFLSFRD
jgi:hypothetical protein